MRTPLIYDKNGRPLRKWGEERGELMQFASPTLKDLRPVNPVVTNLSIAMRNENFFWDQIAPVMEVTEKSGTIPIYTAGFWFRRQQGAERAADAPYLRVGYGASTTTYDTIEYGFEKLLGDPIVAGSQFPDDQEEVAAEFIANLIQLEMEKLVAAEFFVASKWNTDNTLSGTSQWSDQDASDPIADMQTAKRTIRREVGSNPNLLAVGALAWEKLQEHPLLIDKYKHTSPGPLNQAQVADALGIDEIVVMDSVEETTAQGGAGTRADIWTDNALVLVRNQPGLMVKNGGYMVMWNEKGNIPWSIDTYREEKTRGNVTRGFTHADPKIVSSVHGYLFIDTVA